MSNTNRPAPVAVAAAASEPGHYRGAGETLPQDRPLLDGARPEHPDLSKQWETERSVAADPNRVLVDRLEAYENVVESEVGDTSLGRARNLERELGLRQLFLKFEGGNPSGTQKDRIAFAQTNDALRRGFDGIAAASCGNYGVALGQAAKLAGLRCVIHIPAGYHTTRVHEMVRHGAEIVRAAGHYETAVELSRAAASSGELYDANPGGDNTALQLRAYGQIAYEIYDDLRDAPAAVAVPVSNGTTLAGIHRGFVSLYRRGKTSRIPRLVAGSSSHKNPIVRAILRGRPSCEDLDPDRIRETATNEPLVNWHSIDGDLAVEAIRGTEGWARNASDRSMRATARQLREHQGLSVLPASTAGLIALLEHHRHCPLPGDRYVAVLTGRR